MAMRYRLRVLAGLAAITSATVMCTPEGPSSPGSGQAVVLSADQVSRVLERSQLPNGRAATRWVADLHTRAMQRWMNDRPRRARNTKPENCAEARSLVRAFRSSVSAALAVPQGAIDNALEAGAAAAAAPYNCPVGVPPLALWVTRSSGRLSVSAGDTVVTGAYEAYVPGLEAAIAAAADPDAAIAETNAVLGSAASLPEADFYVLSALASLAISSAWYWYELEASMPPADMSILWRQNSRFSWRMFGAADLAGGLFAVRALRTLGAVHPYLIAAGLFGGAAIGSALYVHEVK